MRTPSSSLQKKNSANREYWAFISYQHADNDEEGRQWATWLHQAIETYDVPSDLVGTRNSRGETIPERIFPIFRDEEELAADSDLAGPIYSALESSKYLVVICSPRAVMSQYVANEIAFFKRTRSDRVLAMMIDGEPGVEDNKEKAAAGIEECFPLPLRFQIDPEGRLTDLPEEPIAADFRLMDERGRPSLGWTSPEAYRQDLARKGISSRVVNSKVSKYRNVLDLMKLKVIAGILGVPLGTLTKRDQAHQLVLARKRARALRRWLCALAFLAIAAIGGGVFAWLKKEEADSNAQRARENLSNQLASEGLEYFSEGRIREGLAYLDASLRDWPENPVAQQRFLYELMYRKWTVPSAVFPAPPDFQPPDPAARLSGLNGTGFKVLAAERDGRLELEQVIAYEGPSSEPRRFVRTVVYEPDTKEWSVGERREQSEKDVDHYILENGLELRSDVIDDGALGYSSFEAYRDGVPQNFKLRNGDYEQNIVPHGFLAVNAAHSRLLFASAGNPTAEHTAEDQNTIVLSFFDTTRLELIRQHVIHTNGRTELAGLKWAGNDVILQSYTRSWNAQRIDVLRVKNIKSLELEMVVEDFFVKDRQWAWHDGSIYLLSSQNSAVTHALVAYRPMESVMTRWSAENYRGSELELFSAQKIDGKLLGTENTKPGPLRVGAVQSPSKKFLAYSEDGHNIIIATRENHTIKNVIPTEVSANWRSLAGLAFSADESVLLAIGKMAPLNGDAIDWEAFDVATGRQIFPIVEFGFYPSNAEPHMPEGLGGYLEPFTWTADGKCLVFGMGSVGEERPKSLPRSGAIRRIVAGVEFAPDSRFSAFPGGHLTELKGKGQFLVHPIYLANSACPAWFLDLAQQLYLARRRGVAATEPVAPPTAPLRDLAGRAAEEHSESEYAYWAHLIAETAPGLHAPD